MLEYYIISLHPEKQKLILSIIRNKLLNMKTNVLGYPRIGEKRELKKANEAFWEGKLSEEELLAGLCKKKRVSTLSLLTIFRYMTKYWISPLQSMPSLSALLLPKASLNLSNTLPSLVVTKRMESMLLPLK